MLVEAIRQGRVHVSRLGNEALLKDYGKFQYDKVIGPILLKEIFRRTKDVKWLEKDDTMRGFHLLLYPDHWRLVDRYWIGEPSDEGEYPIDDDHLWIFNPSKEQKSTIQLYTLRAKIQTLVKRIKAVRAEVKKDPEKARKFWNRMYTAQKQLEKLDPYNRELDYGIYGLPFDAGLVDQG